MFYRGKDKSNWEREMQSITELAENIFNKNVKNYDDSLFGHLHFLKSPDFLRSFRCVGILTMVYSVCGIYTISTYTDTFMEVWTKVYLP